ncbi:MAG TPA: ATP-binding protein [Candidatus Binatia bacterium]|nr:ATP-binding protein [Candidatus Binatia bacterium]
MATATAKTEWLEANLAFLAGEFARLCDQLGAKEAARHSAHIVGPAIRSHAELEPPPAIDQLAELLGLSTFERELLLLCAGVEMDSKLAARCAEAQGHPQQAYVTFGLAMAALTDPHWSALTPSRPLRRFRLVEVEGGRSLASSPVRIDERILHFLAGMNLLDQRLESFLRVSPRPQWIADQHRSLASRALRVIESYSQFPPLVHLCGDDPQGHEDVAALAAQDIGRPLLVLRVEDLPPVGAELDQFALLWERESLLLPGALLMQCAAGLTAPARHLIERLPGLIFLSSREPVRLERAFLRFDVNKPDPVEQKHLWQRALGPAAANFNGALDDLAEQFRLSARMIFSTGALLSHDGGSDNVGLQARDLWNACCSLARPRLEDLAQRIVPYAGWDDLVLPEVQKQVLRQITAQVRHRMQVYESWGFSARGRRGLGVSALFVGESGTGKTLAAEVLAHELGLDLYRIDLSAVVSKYIGETEKNLKQVFDAAEEGGVLLLFDEADALFGKRGEVKDSHDRYANIEVSYLLQRMEAYQGLAILTTNLKSAMDRAFQRRLRFTVNFPFPDAAQREEIWSRVFPATTPTQDLSLKRLSQLNVAGGNIRNIALNAAFLAAEAGTPVVMAHLAEAAKLEAQKMDRPLSEAEIRGWV